MAYDKYADQFVDWLLECGYTHCFFVAGGNIMHLLDSVRTRMICIPVIHEVAAGIAAEYFNATRNSQGGRAFVLVTAGPGLTNLVTAIAGAWQESRELLVVGGQVKSDDLGHSGLRQRGLQEIDGVGLVSSITKAAIRLERPIAKSALSELVHISCTPRRGPVFIEFCLDAQAAPPVGEESSLIAEVLTDTSLPAATGDQLTIIETLLNQSQRPVLLLGGGLDRAHTRQLAAQIERFGVPVMTTWNGADRFDNSHPLYWGRPNLFGQRSANILIQQSDLVIALGTRLGLQQTGFNWREFVPDGTIVQVDIDEEELRKPNPAIDFGFQADANDVLTRLLACPVEPGSHWSQWRSFGRHVQQLLPWKEDATQVRSQYISSYDLIELLPGAAEPDAVFIPSSSGGTFTSSYQVLRLRHDQQVMSNKSLASMGYGLAAALGTALSVPGRQVIHLEGDGGFAQNLQELSTIASQGANIKIFLMDNGGYASIKTTQRNYFGGSSIGCDASTGLILPDWEKIAASFGVPYVRLQTDLPTGTGLGNLLQGHGPVLLHVKLDPDQQYLPKMSSRVLADGTMESNPLHLMSPSLSDDVAAEVFRYGSTAYERENG